MVFKFIISGKCPRSKGEQFIVLNHVFSHALKIRQLHYYVMKLSIKVRDCHFHYLTTVGYSSELYSTTVPKEAEENPLPTMATTVLAADISAKNGVLTFFFLAVVEINYLYIMMIIFEAVSHLPFGMTMLIARQSADNNKAPTSVLRLPILSSK